MMSKCGSSIIYRCTREGRSRNVAFIEIEQLCSMCAIVNRVDLHEFVWRSDSSSTQYASAKHNTLIIAYILDKKWGFFYMFVT